MHTKEPWEYRESIVYLGKEGGFCLSEAPKSHENARRIVACVNACAGLATDNLENISMVGDSLLGRITSLRKEADAAYKLEQQRDELLAALKAALIELYENNGLSAATIKQIDAAIDKCEA